MRAKFTHVSYWTSRVGPYQTITGRYTDEEYDVNMRGRGKVQEGGVRGIRIHGSEVTDFFLISGHSDFLFEPLRT